jgi:hypothetical protein
MGERVIWIVLDSRANPASRLAVGPQARLSPPRDDQVESVSEDGREPLPSFTYYAECRWLQANLTCSPNSDAGVMRVHGPMTGKETSMRRERHTPEQVVRKLREAESLNEFHCLDRRYRTVGYRV